MDGFMAMFEEFILKYKKMCCCCEVYVSVCTAQIRMYCLLIAFNQGDHILVLIKEDTEGGQGVSTGQTDNHKINGECRSVEDNSGHFQRFKNSCLRHIFYIPKRGCVWGERGFMVTLHWLEKPERNALP